MKVILKKSLCSIVCSALLLFSLSQAKASSAEICFSSITDSEWQNGQPVSINLNGISSQVNLRISGDAPMLEKSQVEIAYKYLGANCSRTVTTRFDYQMKFTSLSDNQFLDLVKKNQNPIDYFKLKDLEDGFSRIRKLLSSGGLSVILNSDNSGQLEWNEFANQLSSNLINIRAGCPIEPFCGLLAMPVIEPVERCFQVLNTSAGKNILYSRIPLAPFAFNDGTSRNWQVIMSKQNCTGRISLLYFSDNLWSNSYPMVDKGTQPDDRWFYSILFKREFYRVDIGEIQLLSRALKPLSNAKTTITCVKGKLTKKVTAVNPKCPAGYKKK